MLWTYNVFELGIPQRRIGIPAILDILLVEDNPADQRLIVEALARHGRKVTVVHVTDGVAAIETLKKRYPHKSPPRLIITDLNMPNKNGLELLSELKTDLRFRKIPVVMLTSSGHPKDVSAAYDAFVNCYIEKPADLAKFHNVIEAIESFWLKTVLLPH